MSLVLKPRASISTGFIVLVILCVAWMIGMVLNARYKFAIQQNEKVAAQNAIPKAIPVGMPVELKIHQARAYKQEDWWVIPLPTLIDYYTESASALRFKAGTKEEIFELYGVESPVADSSYPKRLMKQRERFNIGYAPLLNHGDRARTWVHELLQKYPCTIYTQWERVPGSERFYAFIHVELQPNTQIDLGELMVRNGYALPTAPPALRLPSMLPTSEVYEANLNKAISAAKADRMGFWKSVAARP